LTGGRHRLCLINPELATLLAQGNQVALLYQLANVQHALHDAYNKNEVQL